MNSEQFKKEIKSNQNGALTQSQAVKLLGSHGLDLNDYISDCGSVLNVETILDWMGY